MNNVLQNLVVTSDAFGEGETIPEKYTGHGRDISPKLFLSELSVNAKSMAILMDDISHPLFREYNHWIIWNLPVKREIPENIPHGKTPDLPKGAVQGIGYGRHRYRGPKPPFGMTHQYRYTVYVLDWVLEISPSSKKANLLEAMEGHILQQGCLFGKYK